MDAASDRAIPVLTVVDLDEAVEFYGRLGFDVRRRDEGYAIVERQGAEIHLSHWPDHDPLTTAGAVYLRIADVDTLYTQLRADLERDGCLYLAPASGLTRRLTAELRARLSNGERLVRLHEIEDKPWGMRQFSVIDPSGNAVRIGRPLRDG